MNKENSSCAAYINENTPFNDELSQYVQTKLKEHYNNFYAQEEATKNLQKRVAYHYNAFKDTSTAY